MSQPEDEQYGDKDSAVPNMTRKEFLALVVKRATIAGAIVAAPQIADKFLVPPAYAAVSRTTGPPAHRTDLG